MAAVSRTLPGLAAGLAAFAVLTGTAATGPAQAQSFFAQLFGLAPPPPQVRRAAPPPAPNAGLGQAAPRWTLEPRERRAGSATGDGSGGEGRGSYTTVCVRLCDGYYFPISHRVSRGRFYRDADACRSRCGSSEARLFYHASGADMKSAVDVTGRPYSRLATAFLHRKQIVEGCTCRPAPWSVSERSRHIGYALAEGRHVGAMAAVAAPASVIAGRYGTAAPATAAAAIAAGDAAAAAAGEAPADTTADAATAPAGEAPPAAASPRAVSPRAGRATVAARSGRSSAGAGTGKPAAARTASGPSATAAPRKPTRVASASPWGFGGGSYTWPGDAPRRR